MNRKEKPLLSVIIPVYNAQPYLERCISSVLNQRIREVEILCVDDGSTDASADILERLALHDARIRVLRQQNLSAGAARNRALLCARGEYVHFLDADDWLCDGIYERSIQLLEKTEADVCVFQYLSFDNSTGEVRKCPCLLNCRDRVTSFHRMPEFFMYNMVAPWNKVYRRSWLEEHGLRFDEIVCGNDRGFYFRMLAAQGKIVLTGAYGIFYRVANTRALTGANRYRHFDSLFYAWDSSAKALEKESAQIRAMLLDCVVKDLLMVFRAAPVEKREEIAGQLRQRFSETDFSVLQKLPIPCTWRGEAKQICDGTYSGQIPKRPWTRFVQLVAACRIWGISGCVVKYWSGRRKTAFLD